MDGKKVQYAQKVQEVATQAALVLVQLSELVNVWDDRLYGPGAANEITADDLDVGDGSYGSAPAATPNDLYSLVIAASQIGSFVEGNGSAVAGPYSATFNKLRRDM